MIRILSGKYKLKKISIPKEINFSPISSFLKSNIFNILQNKIIWNETITVDLFSGTGNLGLEALSRNSKFVYFNDISDENILRLKLLIGSLKNTNNEISNLNYFQFLLKLIQLNKKVNLIFIDPPYKEELMIEKSLDIIHTQNILNENGIIVITSSKKLEFKKYDKFYLFLKKKYGKNFIYFLNFKKEIKKINEEKSNNSKVLIISGPSGVGKKSIIKNLINTKKLNLIYSISTTTRKLRKNEKNGKDYNFLTVKEFEEKIKIDDFLEYAKFIDNYYGTSKSFVEFYLKKGKNVLLEIEILGALKIKKKIPDSTWIFIFPPSIKELKNRLKKRGTEKNKEIDNRLEKAIQEMRFISINNKCDFIIFNETIEKTSNEIIEFLEKKDYCEN